MKITFKLLVVNILSVEQFSMTKKKKKKKRGLAWQQCPVNCMKIQYSDSKRWWVGQLFWRAFAIAHSEYDCKLKHDCVDHNIVGYDFIINRNGRAGTREQYNESLKHWNFPLVINKLFSFYHMEQWCDDVKQYTQSNVWLRESEQARTTLLQRVIF